MDVVITTGTGKDAKTLALAKKVTGNSATVRVPLGAAPGSYKLVVRTADKFGPEKSLLASTGITFAVVAPTITATSASSVVAGAGLTIGWSYGKGSNAPVKLELFKGSGTKPVKTISRSATGGSLEWSVPVDLPAGSDYFVRATSLGMKPPATDDTPALAISVPTVSVADSPYASGLTVGETVTSTWTATGSADLTVNISLLKGTKVVAKLAAKATTTDGSGQFQWVVPTKLVAGDDYTVRVADATLSTIVDASAAFAISANPTTLG